MENFEYRSRNNEFELELELEKRSKTLPLREGCWDVDEMEKAINRFRIEWGMTIKNRASTF